MSPIHWVQTSVVAIPNIENVDQCWLSKYVKLNKSYLFFSCDGFQLADDEITSATVGLVLDSLDDIHCITEAKHKDQVKGHTLPTIYHACILKKDEAKPHF